MKDKKNENLDSEDFELVDDEAVSSPETASSSVQNSAEVDVADLKAQLQKASTDYLYLRAEFDNFRKQSIKERADLLRYGGERLAKDLLDSLDIFETALASEVTSENFKVFVDGIKMTSQSLLSTLQRHGITDVATEGKVFDPAINEALGSEPTDKFPPGHVTKVFKKPYKFHDKVLRTGKVIVAMAKPKE